MNQTLEQLRNRFADAAGVSIDAGAGDLTRLTLRGQGALAELYPHGSHLANWQPEGHEPVLWMSRKSWFETGKPIRGGVPVCLPWFGPKADDPEAPSHGFARLMTWQVKEITANHDDTTTVQTQLEPNDASRSLWPHEFVFRHRVTVGQRLIMELEVENTDAQPFTFTAALHSYFCVADVRHVRVEGLEGAPYLSKVQGGTMAPSDEPIDVAAEVDRVYMDSTATCRLRDPRRGRTIVIEKEGSRSTVVWNPWVDKSAAMPDFGDDEWPGMICIETGNCLDDAVTLQPGERHVMRATLNVEKA